MSDLALNPINNQFLMNTVTLTVEFLSDILFDIQNITSVESELEFKRNKKIIKLTADVSQFVELTTLLTKAIAKPQNQIVHEIKSSHIHLLFILKGMNQARVKLDHVALEELIKYELKDNLTQWKIDLIPHVKKLLNI